MDIRREQAISFLTNLDISNDKILSRIKGAQNVEILSVNEHGTSRGEAVGSNGEVYRCTLGTCSCTDWTHRKDKEIPCKHQIALAMKFIEMTGGEDENAKLLASFRVIDNPKPNAHTIAFAFKNGDPRYSALCEIAKEKGYMNVCSMTFDIVDEWLKQARPELRDCPQICCDTECHSSAKDNTSSFTNKTFLFTGSLEHMKREEAQARVEALGGKTATGVSKTLSVLVATSQTSTKWRKAQELNEKGANIALWNEEQFLSELEKAEQQNNN